jgi:hypothetical protein
MSSSYSTSSSISQSAKASLQDVSGVYRFSMAEGPPVRYSCCFDGVTLEQDAAARPGELLHHLELALTPFRPDKLDEDAHHPVEGMS